MVDEAIAAVWATQAQLVAGLTETEQEHLSALLRTLLLTLEGAESTNAVPSPPRAQALKRQVDRFSRRTRSAEQRPS